MTWRKTAITWLAGLALAGLWVLTTPETIERKEAERQPAVLLDAPEEEIRSFVLRRGDLEVRCERVEKRWKVVHPADVSVPVDLVSALLDNFTDDQQAELVNDDPTADDLASFGLDDPDTVYEIGIEGREAPIVIRVGGKNPPQTAVYTETTGMKGVILAGLNVDYYGDLLFQAAYPMGGPTEP